MSWKHVGEALRVAELARACGASLGEAAWEYAAEKTAYMTGQLGGVPVNSPGVRRDRERLEPGLAAVVAAWLAEAD